MHRCRRDKQAQFLNNQTIMTALKILKTIFSIFVLLAWSSLNSADFQYEILKAGETKPEGWIKQQMRLDLESGLTGNYHKVSNAVNLKVFENQNRPAGGKVEIPGEERLQKSKTFSIFQDMILHLKNV